MPPGQLSQSLGNPVGSHRSSKSASQSASLISGSGPSSTTSSGPQPSAPAGPTRSSTGVGSSVCDSVLRPAHHRRSAGVIESRLTGSGEAGRVVIWRGSSEALPTGLVSVSGTGEPTVFEGDARPQQLHRTYIVHSSQSRPVDFLWIRGMDIDK